MPRTRTLGTAVNLAQLFVTRALRAGETAVDATAGNGNDTLFLAQLVGEQGQVFAFDVQEQALTKTKERLAAVGTLNQVQLILAGHEQLSTYVQDQVAAVMFNLGYLPGGDHQLITKPETTLQALKASLNLLRVGGVISIVVYSGHQGGDHEAFLLEEYLRTLDQACYSVLKQDFLNRKNNSPYLILIEREK